jgi:hypothetical protein
MLLHLPLLPLLCKPFFS